MLGKAKDFLDGLIDIGLALVTISVVFQAVFGSVIPFVGGDVVYNLMALLNQFGDSGFEGLVALAIFYYLLRRHLE